MAISTEPTRTEASALRSVALNPEWWMVILTLVGIVVLAYQIGDARKSIQGATYQSLIDRMFEVNRVFFDHPQFRPYFYDGAKPSDEFLAKHGQQLATLTEWVSDLFDNVYQHKSLVGSEAYEEWRRYMMQIHGSSPYLRDFLESECGWYVKLYNELTGKACVVRQKLPEAR